MNYKENENFDEDEGDPELNPEIIFEDLIDGHDMGFNIHEQHQNILFTTISMLEKSFWWKFYSVDRKINLIKKTYEKLSEILYQE